ncbi:hypothetical protein QEH40_gp17 [Microbacterium phage OscarSo]|uniref:Uncharacterized protein n=1 Tax=Microbacterium phage OscarSo TaxID=2985324 RepID=A0A9X9K2S3_9CAUD|nr:hypothetical protein QEH40_gp17 [Microbacterium phage OscarSo]UYL87138.1 hypothetical protein SEA_OSCARSO_17 [Microbacterium phage OscarSo]
MTEEQKTESGAAELVTPEEHAETTESLEPGQDVSEPEVPADVEVAARSADMDSPSTTHEKIFVLGPGIGNPSKNPYTEANGYDHEPNKAAARQYAIDSGMWPVAPVEFKSAKRHPDGVSWILTYTVEVIPAHDAAEGAQTPRVTGSDGKDAAHEESANATEATNYAPPAETVEGDEPTE